MLSHTTCSISSISLLFITLHFISVFFVMLTPMYRGGWSGLINGNSYSYPFGFPCLWSLATLTLAPWASPVGVWIRYDPYRSSLPLLDKSVVREVKVRTCSVPRKRLRLLGVLEAAFFRASPRSFSFSEILYSFDIFLSFFLYTPALPPSVGGLFLLYSFPFLIALRTRSRCARFP